MFARLFPLNTDAIMHEACQGMITALFNLPINLILGAVETTLSIALNNYHLRSTYNSATNKIAVIDQKIKQLEELRQAEIESNFSKKTLARLAFFHPIAEEILFRGLLTHILKEIAKSAGISESLAPLLSCIIFASMHQKAFKINAGYFGYKSEKLTEQYHGSLWASMAAHITNNMIVYGSRYALRDSTRNTNIKEFTETIAKLKTAKEQLTNKVSENKGPNSTAVTP